MKNKFCLLALIVLTGCFSTSTPSNQWDTNKNPMLRFPKRTLAEWQPELAVLEAQQDIESGKPKIYISGTVAAYPPGVEPDQFYLIAPLPKADAGIGCLVGDVKFRKAQFDYATEYNKYVVKRLSRK